jgi:hypothetical protein
MFRIVSYYSRVSLHRDVVEIQVLLLIIVDYRSVKDE